MWQIGVIEMAVSDAALDNKLIVVHCVDYILKKKGVSWSHEKPQIPSTFSFKLFLALNQVLDQFDCQYCKQFTDLMADIDSAMMDNPRQTMRQIGAGLMKEPVKQGQVIALLYFAGMFAYKLHQRSVNKHLFTPLPVVNETSSFLTSRVNDIIQRAGGWERWLLEWDGETDLSRSSPWFAAIGLCGLGALLGAIILSAKK